MSAKATTTAPTFYWEIEGLGTTNQTLIVYGADMNKLGSETRESWSWTGEYPDAVGGLMPLTLEALMALQQGTIEKVQ